MYLYGGIYHCPLYSTGTSTCIESGQNVAVYLASVEGHTYRYTISVEGTSQQVLGEHVAHDQYICESHLITDSVFLYLI